MLWQFWLEFLSILKHKKETGALYEYYIGAFKSCYNYQQVYNLKTLIYFCKLEK